MSGSTLQPRESLRDGNELTYKAWKQKLTWTRPHDGTCLGRPTVSLEKSIDVLTAAVDKANDSLLIHADGPMLTYVQLVQALAVDERPQEDSLANRDWRALSDCHLRIARFREARWARRVRATEAEDLRSGVAIDSLATYVQ